MTEGSQSKPAETSHFLMSMMAAIAAGVLLAICILNSAICAVRIQLDSFNGVVPNLVACMVCGAGFGFMAFRSAVEFFLEIKNDRG